MAASSEIEKLERRYAENPDGRYFAPLADAYRKAGQADRALEVVRAGLEKHPDYLSAHIVLGRCLLDKKEDEGAGQAFERVLGLDSENIIALKSLSEIAERRGEPVSARQWLQKLLQVDPMNTEADADLQRLGGAIAEAPTAPMEALPADLGSAQPSEFSFADVTPGEPGADVLPEPAQVADLALEALPVDAPAQTESVVPGIISVQFQPPAEDVPPPDLEIKPFDESLAWGTGERSSRFISQHDVEAALHEHDQSVADPSQALEMVQNAAEGHGDAGALGMEGPPEAGSPPAPAAATPDASGDAWSGRASLQAKAVDLDALEIERDEAEVWPAEDQEPGAAPALPELAADVELEPSLSDLPIIMPEDVTPPEEMARPSGKRQRAVVEPLSEGAAAGESPPLVTETMGDLYLQQGFRAEAAEVYRSVLAQRSDDAGLRAKLAALEAPPPALSARALGGESVRTWLRRVASARVAALAPAGVDVVPAGLSPLEEAFAQPELPAEPAGEPTHQARDAFTLDAIFGGQPPGSSPAAEREAAPPTGTSFDEFFGAPAEQASVRPDSAAPPAPPPPDDDVNSFSTWLRGLKR